jgi:hypothetical protein
VHESNVFTTCNGAKFAASARPPAAPRPGVPTLCAPTDHATTANVPVPAAVEQFSEPTCTVVEFPVVV